MTERGALGQFAAKAAIVTAIVVIGLHLAVGQIFDRLNDTIGFGATEMRLLGRAALHCADEQHP